MKPSVQSGGGIVKQPSLEDLLQIENDPAFLEFRCQKTNYLLWPLVRTQFFRQLISDLFYKHASLLAPISSVPYRKALSVLPKVLIHNIRQQKIHSEILVFGTGAGHFQRAGLWFNRITDYLVEASLKDVSTIEGVIDWHLPEPRWNKQTSYWLPWQTAMLLVGRICSREVHVRQAREILEYARGRAFDLYGITVSQQNMEMLVGVIARKIARLSTMEFAYRNMLEKFKPRLLLLEEGCYSDHGILNHIAREMGVRVAEPQHGMISGGHDAYNYAPLLRGSEHYQRYLPHDFLGYGRWWNDQINVPVKKWVLGHPHYSEQQCIMKGMAAEKMDVLILCDGIEFPVYLALAQELDALLKGRYRVVLRPHPLERTQVYAKFPSGMAENVYIDRNRDIYESFGSAYVVAGEVSTGLFEAIGMVPKVLLWETAKAKFSYPVHPFYGFSDAREFAVAILAQEGGQLSVDQDAIWAPDWRDNYRRYLEHALG
jgi:hypothetical protein